MCVCVGCDDDDDGMCAFQNLLNLSPDQRKSAIQATQTDTTEKVALTSLKEFSIEYFRSVCLTVCLSLSVCLSLTVCLSV